MNTRGGQFGYSIWREGRKKGRRYLERQCCVQLFVHPSNGHSVLISYELANAEFLFFCERVRVGDA